MPLPNYIAHQDTIDLLARLKTAIADTGHSLRGLERITAELGLTDIERIQHGNLSETLRGKSGRDLSVQTLLAICKLITVNPIAIVDGPDAALSAEIMAILPPPDRQAWIQDGLARLEAANGTSRRLESLRQAALDSAARSSTKAKMSRTRRPAQ